MVSYWMPNIYVRRNLRIRDGFRIVLRKVEILALCYNSGDFCRYNFGIAQREMFLRHVKTFGTQFGSKLLLKILGWQNTPNSLKERFVITIIDIVTIILINNWQKIISDMKLDRIVFMLLKILIFNCKLRLRTLLKTNDKKSAPVSLIYILPMSVCGVLLGNGNAWRTFSWRCHHVRVVLNPSSKGNYL